MVMIAGTGTISNYGQFINNCQANQMPYKVPVNSFSDVQLYINIGATKPDAVQYQLIHTCGALGGTIETITPGDYVVGQDTNGNWYGVFKNFNSISATCFVIGITLTTGATDVIYFSEEYCIENNCNSLTFLQGCYGNLSNLISYDSEGVYFGTPSGDTMGDTTVKYKHQLLLRKVEVTLAAIKNSFKQGRTRNFRTEKEKIFRFWGERVPEWYLSEIDAVFYRGEVYVGSRRYLVNETEYELIEDCSKQWMPAATFKESKYQSFSCEADPCAAPVAECCDPEITSVEVEEVPYESGFGEESPGGGTGGIGDTVVVQAVVDGAVDVTGTFEAVTGITDGSTIISSDAFAYRRVFVQRGSIQIPGIDPGDGSNYYTKTLAGTDITFSQPLVTGELVYIETIE